MTMEITDIYITLGKVLFALIISAITILSILTTIIFFNVAVKKLLKYYKNT